MNTLQIKNKRIDLIFANELISKAFETLLFLACTPFYYFVGYLADKYFFNLWCSNQGLLIKISLLVIIGIFTLAAIGIALGILLVVVASIGLFIYYAFIKFIARAVYEIKFTKVIQYMPISQEEIAELKLEDYVKYEAYILDMFAQLPIKFPKLLESCFADDLPNQLVEYLQKSIDSHVTANNNEVFSELVTLGTIKITYPFGCELTEEKIIPYLEFTNRRSKVLAKAIVAKSFSPASISKHFAEYKENLDTRLNYAVDKGAKIDIVNNS